MKFLLAIFLLGQIPALAQPRVKKCIVEGEGIPVILLAGGTGDMSVYAKTAKALSANYKVIRIEHFNVQYADEGLTLPANYSLKIEATAIKNTLDSLGVEGQIILVGHSYGGIMALDFALSHPDDIRSLVLIEPPLFGIPIAKDESPPGMENMQVLTRELQPQAQITEKLVKRFRCLLMNCDSINIRQHPQWATWVAQKNRLRGLSEVNNYMVSLKKIRKFDKPVLIITGTQTAAFHKRIDELLAGLFPNVMTVSLPSGHAIPATVPDELTKTLQDFFK